MTQLKSRIRTPESGIGPDLPRPMRRPAAARPVSVIRNPKGGPGALTERPPISMGR